MEAAQDHYGSTGYYSPMVFLSKDAYQKPKARVYELVQQVAEGREYRNFLHLTDEPVEVVDFIKATHRSPPNKLY